MKTPAGFNPQPPRPAWGIRPAPRKALAMRRPIVAAPVPAQVVIPVRQCLGRPAQPLVRIGQRVLTGEPIARAAGAGGGLAAYLHASISGTITAIEDRPVPAATPTLAPCIVIDGDGRDERYGGYTGLGDPLELDPGRIRALLAEAGIVGLGGALFPTAEKLAAGEHVPTLILNGAECEPYIACDEILMREHARRVLDGARILMRATGAETTVVGIESDMPEARVAIRDAIEAGGHDDILVSVVTANYPAGGERQLIELILGRQVPATGLPQDIGVVCQNVGTAAAAADLFRAGQPLISRLVTVTGRGIAEPLNIEARIGTRMADLFAIAGGVQQEPSHLIMGGPMMGITLTSDELPVTKATNCLILMTPDEISPTRVEMPCIRCGECSRVCPAQLMPQELLTASRRHDMAALDELGLDACIECGCCDFVCPSQILLTDRFIDAKRASRAHAAEAEQAVRARARFEAREARLARHRRTATAELERQTHATDADESIEELMARVAAKRPPHEDDN